MELKIFGNLRPSTVEVTAKLSAIEKKRAIKSQECAAVAEQIETLEIERSNAASAALLEDGSSREADRRVATLKARIADLSKKNSDLAEDLQNIDRLTLALNAEFHHAEKREKESEFDRLAKTILSACTDVEPILREIAAKLKPAVGAAEGLYYLSSNSGQGHSLFLSVWRDAIAMTFALHFKGLDLPGILRPHDFRSDVIAEAANLRDYLQKRLMMEAERFKAGLEAPQKTDSQEQ